MKTIEQIWLHINRLTAEYNRLNLTESIDYQKFYLYSIITHSTAIEGSTLTEVETQMLFDEGIAAKKPMAQNLMNLDLKNAYEYATAVAEERTSIISPDFLKNLNSLVMKSTGSGMSTMGGSFDTSRRDYRLCSVTAGYGGKSYMSYQKVPQAVDAFCARINELMGEVKTPESYYHSSLG